MAQLLKVSLRASERPLVEHLLVDPVESCLDFVEGLSEHHDLKKQTTDLRIGVRAPHGAQFLGIRRVEFRHGGFVPETRIPKRYAVAVDLRVF